MATHYPSLGVTSEDIPGLETFIAGGFPRAEMPALIAQGSPALKRGTILGAITASGKLRRYSRAAVMTGGAFATDSDTGKVSGAATIFLVGDVLKNAAGTTVGTIESIDGDTITLAANAAVAVAVGADIYADGGSGTPVGVLGMDTVAATDGDLPTFMYVTGEFNEALLIGLNAASRTALAALNIYAKRVS